MRTLVIETATAACSVALIDDGAVVARAHAVVGRGHAERLVPMIADLPDGGRSDRILVDCGPGSFTGVRVGLAAARGLGLGWGVPVTGYSSLTLIAAAGFAARPTAQPTDDIAVLLEGGHGEVFMAVFSSDLHAHAPLASLLPEAALAALGDTPVIGNAAARLLAIDPTLAFVDALPDAADAVHLPPHLADLPATPIYGRAPDAKPMAKA